MFLKRIFPALVLAVAVLFINSPILKYPLSAWIEPREVIAHAVIVLLLHMLLRRRVSAWAAFLAALGFGIFPGHAIALAEKSQNLLSAGLYLMALAVSIAVAFAFDKFDNFLKTQEKIVRQLFIVGVGVLILWMAVVSVQTNAVWANDMSLARWRAKHAPSAENLNHLASLLQGQKGQDKEVMELYKKVLTLDPQRKEPYFYFAWVYEESEQPDKAIEMYNGLLKKFSGDETVHAAVVDAYGGAIARHPQETIYQEKREEVLAAYEQLSKRKKYTANDYFNLGFLYEQVGGYEEAMRFYGKALEIAPTHEKALYNLANRYQLAGDFKTALALYGRLVHYHPKFTFAYLNMGLIYSALGDADRARYLYQKLVDIDPGNADGYFNLGYLSEAAGELREALGYYEKAVENNPKHAEAYYNMGNVYAILQQYPEAIASYLKTVAINPNHQNAFVNLSILAFKSQDFQGAIHYLEEARLLGYNPPEAYLKTLEPYRKK